MGEEIKKTDTGSKIMPFHISEEEMQDPGTDQFVRESLIREADELEAELNRRPDLAGVEAPDEMFQSIVEELKRRGVWEEDEAESGPAAETEAVAEESVAGRESMEETDTAAKDALLGQGSVAEEESASENGAMDGDLPDKVTGFAAGQESAVGKTSDTNSAKENENIFDSETAQKNNGVEKGDTASLEELYAQLPEEDQKALALGREVARKREKKVEKRRRRRKVLKVSGIVAACLAVVFGISMTSEANRRLVKKFWDGVMMDFGFRFSTNYAGDSDSIRSMSEEERKAMEEIREKTGAPIIEFSYLPKGMEYQGYKIADGFDTMLFYSYQGRIFYVTIADINIEGVYYYMYDEDTVLRETLINDIGLEAKIWETNLDIGKETYIAEIEYDGWRYVLNGMLPLDEIRNILKNIIFL